jgi:hypothetical protein
MGKTQSEMSQNPHSDLAKDVIKTDVIKPDAIKTDAAIIAAAQPAEPSPFLLRGLDTFDDMHDSAGEMDRYAAIDSVLRLCDRIAPEFTFADDRAVKFQRHHRWLTRGAAIFGALAVVFSIFGLSRGQQELWSGAWVPSKQTLDWIELWLAGIAVVVVLVGWISHCKESWLRWRHHAESYRLLRYNFLTHPSLWQGREEDARLWIESKLNEISHTELATAVRQPSPHGPFEGTQSQLPRGVLRALTEYYLFKRLNPQKEYLANRTQRNEFSDWIRAYLPWFFFLSVVAVFIKFFVRDTSLRWEAFLALLAALLPAAAAGVRTWRSAFEFSRNKGRFEAAHQALCDLEGRLVNEGFAAIEASGGHPGSDQEPADAYSILRDLSWCEHILESEHREWLRLMYETEWFG